MTPGSLAPCSLVLNYRTAQAPHNMTIPLNEWQFPSSGHPAGTNLAWDSTQRDTSDLVTDLVVLLKPFWPSTTSFTSFIINTYASPTAPARPQVTLALTGGAGTGSATIPAAQATFNFKTTDFTAFKLVMLDARVSSTFQPLEDFVVGTNDDEIALRDYIVLDSNPFRGRKETQPIQLIRVTYTLNEKLRKSYHLD